MAFTTSGQEMEWALFLQPRSPHGAPINEKYEATETFTYYRARGYKILGTPNNITKSDNFSNTQLCDKLLRLYWFFITLISQTLLKLTETQRHSIIICFQHRNNKLRPLQLKPLNSISRCFVFQCTHIPLLQCRM